MHQSYLHLILILQLFAFLCLVRGDSPTFKPTNYPTPSPTRCPTRSPSVKPSPHPSSAPTRKPTISPSIKPSPAPTARPTLRPTLSPSLKPSKAPTARPTLRPTFIPTPAPTSIPTAKPTSYPTSQSTSQPTDQPSTEPSRRPSSQPSVKPSERPTLQPTSQPSIQPSNQPSSQPTAHPTPKPTPHPTTLYRPTSQPSSFPSSQPSITPSTHPTTNPTKSDSTQVSFNLSQIFTNITLNQFSSNGNSINAMEVTISESMGSIHSSNINIYSVLPYVPSNSVTSSSELLLMNFKVDHFHTLSFMNSQLLIKFTVRFILQDTQFSSPLTAYSVLTSNWNRSISDGSFVTLLRSNAHKLNALQLLFINQTFVKEQSSYTVQIIRTASPSASPTSEVHSNSLAFYSSWPIYGKVLFPIAFIIVLPLSILMAYCSYSSYYGKESNATDGSSQSNTPHPGDRNIQRNSIDESVVELNELYPDSPVKTPSRSSFQIKLANIESVESRQSFRTDFGSPNMEQSSLKFNSGDKILAPDLTYQDNPSIKGKDLKHTSFNVTPPQPPTIRGNNRHELPRELSAAARGRRFVDRNEYHALSTQGSPQRMNLSPNLHYSPLVNRNSAMASPLRLSQNPNLGYSPLVNRNGVNVSNTSPLEMKQLTKANDIASGDFTPL